MKLPIPAAPAGVDEAAWEWLVAKVRGYCGWHIAPVITETVTLDGSGTHLMVLPSLQVVNLVSITNDGAPVDPEWSRSGMVRLHCWTRRLRGVVAEVEHGFDEWPDDLTAAMVDMSSTAALAGVSFVSSGAHQVRFESAMSVSQMEILDRYRLPFLQ